MIGDYFCNSLQKIFFRIAEIYDGSASSMNALQNLVQFSLFSALDNFATNRENMLADYKENFNQPNFNFIRHCGLQVCYLN